MSTTRTKFSRGLAFLLAIVFIFSALLFTAPVAHADYIPGGSAKSPKIDYLMIVNSEHPYEFGSDYDQAIKSNIIYLPDAYGEATPIERATAKALGELQAAMKRKGLPIELFSAYRTAEDQQKVYDYYSNLPGWSETNTAALPGYSEHHTGLLVNILIWYGENGATPQWYTETAERQKTIPAFRKLHETLADYGFIDRYPAGKEAITGVSCEPYEIRYVGDPKIAHEIMDHHLCLEEYVALQAQKQSAKENCKNFYTKIITQASTTVNKCCQIVYSGLVSGVKALCTYIGKYR